MTHRLPGIALILITLAAGSIVPSGPAHAAGVNAQISAPEQITLGETVEVLVTLTMDGDEPVPDATVTLLADASFGGLHGTVELSSAISGEDGVAHLRYTPRLAGDRELSIEYLIPDATEPGTTTWAHTVTGAAQLHQSKAGIQVPGVGIWVLMVVLTIVWGILFAVALLVLGISRAGDPGLHLATETAETPQSDTRSSEADSPAPDEKR